MCRTHTFRARCHLIGRRLSRAHNTRGVIVASEVPSALRVMTAHGAAGYNPEYFEWVNIARYRSRFETLRRLEADYGIYRHFQSSGVPSPTDADWHWWGKLNRLGCGAVVVLRGSGGDERRAVNIPWIDPGRSYKVAALLAPKELGTFTGKQLQAGELTLALPLFGQEILELSLPKECLPGPGG